MDEFGQIISANWTTREWLDAVDTQVFAWAESIAAGNRRKRDQAARSAYVMLGMDD